LALNSNYTLSFIGADLTINARVITSLPMRSRKPMAIADPSLTYQITSGSLAFGDSFAGGLSRAAGENIGSYAIGQGTLALSSNYSLSFVGADLTINARAITVTADAKSKTLRRCGPGVDLSDLFR
jgi:hypothetical protein